MNPVHTPQPPNPRHQRGYSLIELSVAMVIAVFLLGGLFTIFQGTRHTSTDQKALAQLQDDERLAVTLITDVIQSAGYFPGAPQAQASIELPSDATFAKPGQPVAGAVSAAGSSLVVRYGTLPNDGILNCVGTPNTTGAKWVFVNTFDVDTTNHYLTCSPNIGIAAVPLVGNVQGLDLMYGVNTAASAAGQTNVNCPADAYLTTPQMTPDDWTNVCDIKVTINFINPLYQPLGPAQPPTPGQPATITFTRIGGLMSKSGRNIVNGVASGTGGGG
jgi:type IV pilus assembly protein PilW